jgi:hypothetical protein
MHFFVRVDGTGNPTNPDVKLAIDMLTGAKDLSGVACATGSCSGGLITVAAKNSAVPDCAMRVARSSEVGPLSSYMPPRSCECFFLHETTGVAPASCKVCSINQDCSGPMPKCNYGYCEIQ